MSISKIITLLQIFNINKVLIANKINSIKNNDKQIDKFIKPKIGKLFKL